MDHMSKKVAEKQADYALGPPWLFKGSALYQLHLVKAEIARTFIPKEFKLVEAFGYTLGGFFLAHYDDSPDAMFDELVVIAGIVWNPPTSCAWAARVLVSSHEACSHGRKEVGLPSHVGIFSKRFVETRDRPKNNFSHMLNMIGIASESSRSKKGTEILVSETKDSAVMSLCSIRLPYIASKSETNTEWMGPMIKMSLPSYSGRTMYNPCLLKYCCQIECRVRAVQPAEVSGIRHLNHAKSCDDNNGSEINQNTEAASVERDNAWNNSVSVLLSKPILALELSHLNMQVNAPTIVVPHSEASDVGE